MINKKQHIVITIIISVYLLVISIFDKNLYSFYFTPVIMATIYFAYQLELFAKSPEGRGMHVILLRFLVIMLISAIVALLTVRVFYW